MMPLFYILIQVFYRRNRKKEIRVLRKGVSLTEKENHNLITRARLFENPLTLIQDNRVTEVFSSLVKNVLKVNLKLNKESKSKLRDKNCLKKIFAN